ncbi:ubiquitin-like domain-containing protein [Streptomyces sp. NPDC004647]|uniref:ubiquitin-like domain-containing protein n=1 Tax=Streptomyces sp. NPDC004647 TaxID=3154671 RepID=UPI0033A4C63C
MSNSQGSHRAARSARRNRADAPRTYGSYPSSTAYGSRGTAFEGPRGAAREGYEPYLPYVPHPSQERSAPYAPTAPYGTAVPFDDDEDDEDQPWEPWGQRTDRTRPYAAGPYSAGAVGGRAAARRAARRKRTAERPEALRRLVPQALVVVFLAGGTSAFIANDKSIRLSVDGVPRTLHTFADDVGELLADEGVAVGPHDIVAPGPDEEIAAGDDVIVRYGRPVTLTLDGERRRIWTTARTVEAALRQLGVRAEGAYLSASRHSRISRVGLDLNVWTERTVTFMADGRERTIRTNAATVQEAVEQAGIVLRGRDATSVPASSFPRDGQTISVLRITGRKEVREEPIAFRTVHHNDPALFQGTEVITQQGEQGVERVTYELRTVNGVKQKPKPLRSEVVRRPRDQVVKVGTRPMPASVAGAEGLNWTAMAQCESGGRPNAVDSSGTYGGLYQFDTHTWHGLGGTGRPQNAPAAEQTFRAKKLYVQRGASPWPHCGRKLHQ